MANGRVVNKTSLIEILKGFLKYVPKVDNVLSNTSTNAIQNKAVKDGLDGKLDTITNSDVAEVLDGVTPAPQETILKSEVLAMVRQELLEVENSLRISILNEAYPVGSIYCSLSATNPQTLFGGTWERIADGRVLQGSNGGNVGTFVEAGLPNITGTITDTSSYGTYFVTSNGSDGAFSWTVSSQTNLSGGSGSQNQFKALTIDASKCNPIYGNSATVQPSALIVNMWKRVA